MVEMFIGINSINIYQSICIVHDKVVYSCR